MPILGCIKTKHYQTNQTFSNTIKMHGQAKESKADFFLLHIIFPYDNILKFYFLPRSSGPEANILYKLTISNRFTLTYPYRTHSQ